MANEQKELFVRGKLGTESQCCWAGRVRKARGGEKSLPIPGKSQLRDTPSTTVPLVTGESPHQPYPLPATTCNPTIATQKSLFPINKPTSTHSASSCARGPSPAHVLSWWIVQKVPLFTLKNTSQGSLPAVPLWFVLPCENTIVGTSWWPGDMGGKRKLQISRF